MSTSMPWVKMYTELLDDPKVGRLPELAQLRFVKLILLAGDCDAGGLIVGGSGALLLDDIAWRFHIERAQLDADLATLVTAGLISITDGVIEVVNFGKRQGRGGEDTRAEWRERQAKRRSRGAVSTPEPSTTTSVTSENVTRDIFDVTEMSRVTPVTHVTPVTRLEESREEKSRGEKREKRETEKIRNPLYDAIAEACALDPALSGDEILQATRKLEAFGATPEQVTKFIAWWKVEDFRGTRGDPPTTRQMLQRWTDGMSGKKHDATTTAYGNYKAKGKTTRREQVSDATPDEREKARQTAARRVSENPQSREILQGMIDTARVSLAKEVDPTQRELIENYIAVKTRALQAVTNV